MVSAQRWTNSADQGEWRDEGHSRQPVVPAPLAHDGRVIDTPEIQHAKAAHFAAHDAALRANPPKPYNGPDYNRADDYERRQEYNRAPQQQYRETQQEYRQAPQEYRQAPQEYNKVNEDYDNYEEKREEPRWRGPLAKIEFTKDGKFIKETPEVAHARAQHLEALSAAKQKAGYSNNNDEGRYYEERQERPQHRREPVDDGQYREEQKPIGNAWQGNQGNQYNTGRGYDVYDHGGDAAQYSRNWQTPGVAKTQNTYY